MKPTRVIKRRKQSKPARHTEAAPHACVGELRLCFEPNVLWGHPDKGHLVVQRCMGCGKPVDVRGVLTESELVNNDEQDDCA